jgi:His-Xaa-Ser system protein HxsD
MVNFNDIIVITDGFTANIKISTSIYSIEAINEAAYAFTENFNILITKGDDDQVTIVFESKHNSRDINNDLRGFAQVLHEYQIRHQLDARNGKIREIIVKHAFSQVDLHHAVREVGGNE